MMSYNKFGKNIFSIDLEEWFHANYEDNLFDNAKRYEVRVIENTNRLLDLLDKYDTKATFFVLGYIVKNFPELVQEINIRGHEIASHGMSHTLVYKLTKDEFRQEAKESKAILEDLTGREVYGFRAPSWSIVDSSKWAWTVLAEEGYSYSASVFPVKNFLYGMPDSPRFEYKPLEGSDFIEFPTSTVKIWEKNIPFSGGAYLRLFPYPIINFLSKKNNRERNERSFNPTIFYIHPREIDKQQPKLKLSFINHMIHYYGISSCYGKLEKILKYNNCISFRDYLNLI